jgi:transposase
VIRIETERDIERLRQIALLQHAELTRLHRRLATLTRALADARGESAAEALQLELTLLQEQLAARTRELFGPSSEQRKRAGAGVAPPRSGPQTGHGPREQATLPLVEVVHVLDAPDQQCPKCGGELREWDGQYETSDEIDIVERTFRLVRHQRQKYTCACGACIETALGPRKLVPGGRYSLDFALAVAVAKYADHAPLARQVRQMARAGLRVDTQTLWDQLLALSHHLAPTYDALWRAVLAAPVVRFDETRWPLLGSTTQAKWYAWAAASEEAIAYRILGTRSGEAADVVLANFTGIAVTDGYDVYQSLCTRRARDATGPPAFTLAHCWSHSRRKFVTAEPAYPVATEMLDMIGWLYDIERVAGEAPDAERAAQRAEYRATWSRAVVAHIDQWLRTTTALPRSQLGAAIGYVRDLWPGLIRFLDDARVPLDTNLVERGMRALAIGRKNHYGSRSERGTQVAALFYTLIESAKLVGIEPDRYLREAAIRAIDNPGTVTLPRDLLLT